MLASVLASNLAASAAILVVLGVRTRARVLLGARVEGDTDEHYSTSRLSEIPGSVGSAAGEAGCSFAPRCPLAEAACRLSPPDLLALEGGRAVACPVTLAREGEPHGAALR